MGYKCWGEVVDRVRVREYSMESSVQEEACLSLYAAHQQMVGFVKRAGER